MLDRAGVCVGQIDHVNEVANTGSVARVVVSAQDLKMGSAAQCSFDRNGYRVSFRRMPFANSSFGVCAGGIEVAQDAGSKTLVTVEIVQYLFDDEFASAIRIDWALNVSLIHGYRYGNSICGAG